MARAKSAYRSKPSGKSSSTAVHIDEVGKLRLVVVADTHSEPHPRAAELIAREQPHAVVHAGDIGDLKVLDDLAKIAPVLAVRGNIDVVAPDLPDALTIDVCDAGQDDAARLFRILCVHIAVYGPKLRADVVRRAQAEDARVVICGHSHVPFIGRDRNLTIFNPGSIGPRRFHLPIVFGVMDVTPTNVRMKHVSCETGQDWMP